LQEKGTRMTLAQPPDLAEVPPIGPRDEEFMRLVADMAKERGVDSRFGLALLHTHFPMSPDEVLAETVDRPSRTLTLKPAFVGTTPGRPTMWRLDGPEPAQVCSCCH
jgi:hypothetical protein